MIRVNRPTRAPRILAGRGAKQRAKLCAEYDLAPEDYRSGRKELSFKRDIYAAKSVKNALIKAQHGKCAFCESMVRAVAHGDVEHFRPKGGYQQRREDDLQKPGYYWLAYEWTNLLFSCQICNQQGKKNLFPLAKPRRRAKSHHDDLATEEPLLVDPAQVDPELHIGFHDEVAFPRSGSRLGKASIEVLGLNRSDLLEDRRTYLAILKRLDDLREVLWRDMVTGVAASEELLEQLRKIDAHLGSCKRDEAEYAAMARAALV